MVMREISAAKFKAQCLALLDDVAEGDELVVTKRGRPVARVVPMEQPGDLRGTATLLVSEEEFLAPLHEDWEPEMPE